MDFNANSFIRAPKSSLKLNFFKQKLYIQQ